MLNVERWVLVRSMTYTFFVSRIRPCALVWMYVFGQEHLPVSRPLSEDQWLERAEAHIHTTHPCTESSSQVG